MHRVQQSAQTGAIAAALDRIPLGIRRRVEHARMVVGVDPVFAGLHDVAQTLDGRSYRTTAHVCFPEHLEALPQELRTATVVLPRDVEPYIVVHELGHVLHHAIGFDCHVPEPVTSYAQRNDLEAFAEAFTAWVCPDAYPWAAPILARDAATPALFAELART